jgi:hypothetical protein
MSDNVVSLTGHTSRRHPLAACLTQPAPPVHFFGFHPRANRKGQRNADPLCNNLTVGGTPMAKSPLTFLLSV